MWACVLLEYRAVNALNRSDQSAIKFKFCIFVYRSISREVKTRKDNDSRHDVRDRSYKEHTDSTKDSKRSREFSSSQYKRKEEEDERRRESRRKEELRKKEDDYRRREEDRKREERRREEESRRRDDERRREEESRRREDDR